MLDDLEKLDKVESVKLDVVSEADIPSIVLAVESKQVHMISVN